MIYVFAPAYQVSGGPEALQQMCYYLRQIGKESVIVFYNYEVGKDPMPSRYHIYGNHWILQDEIIDDYHNSVVVPERKPLLLNQIKKTKKYIWWLSKDNFIYEQASLWKKTKYAIKKSLHIDVIPLDTRYCNFDLKDVIHLCGSKYAYDYVTQELGIKEVHYCVEPISLDFLQMGPYDNPEGRQDVVLYNPSKPSEIMTELLQRNNFKFVPLKGYSPVQLAELYRTSKLYVDFGAFPGPERMPKEAVYFGCNILVGKRNAAANDFDVAIPERYKIYPNSRAEVIEENIRQILMEKNIKHEEFALFRKKVIFLEQDFNDCLHSLF